MHTYVLVDIIEAYEMIDATRLMTLNEVMDEIGKGVVEVNAGTPLKKFVGHKYRIGCYSCELERVVREDTFMKMIENNLIEVKK